MQHITFKPADRPMVEVLVEGVWCAGDLWAWIQDADENWCGQVSWRARVGESARIDRFPAARIRRDETDYSSGGRS